MFRDMKREKQLITENETIEVIKRNENGILSVIGDGGYPYGVPVNYSYDGDKIYFHCAKDGHKIDAITKDDKVCFTIVDVDEVIPEEFNTYYRSAIVFGRAHVISDVEEMKNALRVIVDKFSPDFKEKAESYIEAETDTVCVVAIDIEHISGKQAEPLFG